MFAPLFLMSSTSHFNLMYYSGKSTKIYLHFIARINVGASARSLVKCEPWEKENDYSLFLTGYTMDKEHV